MKFYVSSASGDMSAYSKHLSIEIDECGVNMYTLEIETLEDLNKFIEKIGYNIVYNYDGKYNSIIIYDYYLED